MYDPQIGRWFVPDPANQYWSGYVGMGNNPASMVDPDGRVNWPSLGRSTLGILGGSLEFAAGTETAVVGVGVALMVDGGSRAVLNSIKFADALMDNQETTADDINIPSNIGETAGLLLDHTLDNNKHAFQKSLGLANDFASVAFGGGMNAANFSAIQEAHKITEMAYPVILTINNIWTIYDYKNIAQSNNSQPINIEIGPIFNGDNQVQNAINYYEN